MFSGKKVRMDATSFLLEQIPTFEVVLSPTQYLSHTVVLKTKMMEEKHNSVPEQFIIHVLGSFSKALAKIHKQYINTIYVS